MSQALHCNLKLSFQWNSSSNISELLKNVTLFSRFEQSLENQEYLENGLFLEKVRENLEKAGYRK